MHIYVEVYIHTYMQITGQMTRLLKDYSSTTRAGGQKHKLLLVRHLNPLKLKLKS